MCGILGVVSPYKSEISLNSLQNSMHSRGPDDFKVFNGNFNDKIIEMYFSRLSIIDLNQRSAQPFEKYNKILIFNGEIYNFLEIKKKIIVKI